MKAVLVQDDLAVRESLLLMLQQSGVGRIEVSDSAGSVKLVARISPDVILLAAADVYDRFGRYLPGLFHCGSPRSKVLLLGGRQPAAGAMSAVDAFLPYPIDAQRLAAAIAAVMAPVSAEKTSSRPRSGFAGGSV